MDTGVFLIDDAGVLTAMTEQPYDSEPILQRLLSTHPALLAGGQIDTDVPRRWLLVTREAAIPSEDNGVGRWSVDHVFLDQDAIPTFVEVKRSTDTRIRREVIGQIIEYAANATKYWPEGELRRVFEARCSREGVDADQHLQTLIGEELMNIEFWKRAEENLRTGNIRMLIASDAVPTELQRIVEFLNDQLQTAEILAIEIKQYVGDDKRRVLVPRVVGQTMEAQQRKTEGRSSKQWDEESFFAQLAENRTDAEVRATRKVHEWSARHATRIWYGTGKSVASFGPAFSTKSGREMYPFAVYTYGKVTVQFQYLVFHAPFDREEERQELAQRLNHIAGVNITPDRISLRPSIPLAALANNNAVEEFLKVMEWVVARVAEG